MHCQIQAYSPELIWHLDKSGEIPLDLLFSERTLSDRLIKTSELEKKAET